MTERNGWPGEPGVPLNPERDGWWWIVGAGGKSAMFWSAKLKGWCFNDGDNPACEMLPEEMRTFMVRIDGPCLTPAEVDARIAAAHKEWLAELSHDTDALMEAARQSALEEAAQEMDCACPQRGAVLAKLAKDGPLSHHWPCEKSDDCCALRGAAIRALSDTPPGTYASEAEQERDEFFNRLGRVTEELRLPMYATASRIIEAIRERVDNEREACASVSVHVKVPEGAETWTPLEAWEEALIVFDGAFRDAIRGRALKGETND